MPIRITLTKQDLEFLQDLRKSIKYQTLGREKCKFYIFKPPKSPLSRGL